MKTLHTFTQFVVLLSLPLLLGGCGEKEINSNLKYKNLWYKITSDSVTITGCDNNASGELVIPDTIKGKPVTTIGKMAFFRTGNSSSLTSITIPDSVTSIGDEAFKLCTGLTSITIPDSVTSIGDEAFSLCTRLTSITIGNGVTSISYAAFEACSSLTSIAIGDSVTSIGVYAFVGCSSLTSITIGNSVTSIGDYAFADCTSLTSITIPDSVTSIGDEAFSLCTRLTSITIGNGVTSIGRDAFTVCANLKAITFLGDAPKVTGTIFSNPCRVTIYRKPEAKGWGDTWGGRPVKLISEKP